MSKPDAKVVDLTLTRAKSSFHAVRKLKTSIPEIDRRAKFSTKLRTERGTFAKKDVQDLSWKNYVRFFFDQHPGFKSICQCGKSYEKAESFLSHLQRSGH